MTEHHDGPDTLRIPFIFVKHGDPPPLEWMARHPGWVKFPAVMIPRDSPDHPANGGPYPRFPQPTLAATAPPRGAETEEWPWGRPVSLGAAGQMSRLDPCLPPPFPGRSGPGTDSGLVQDPVAAYLQANAVIERVTGGMPATDPRAAPGSAGWLASRSVTSAAC